MVLVHGTFHSYIMSASVAVILSEIIAKHALIEKEFASEKGE